MCDDLFKDLKYDTKIHPNTGYIANLLVTTGAGLQWAVDFFMRAYEAVEFDDISWDDVSQKFEELVTISFVKGGPFKTNPENVDWKALFKFTKEYFKPESVE